MKYSLKQLFVLMPILLFSGCIETVEAPWNTNPIPVVYSIITPGQKVQVYIGKSFSENDTSKTIPYSEAKVFVCGPDSAWVELVKREGNNAIFVDTVNLLSVIKGKTYSLRVELKDQTLHAQTTIPTEMGIITQAESIFPFTNSSNAGIYDNGEMIPAKLGVINVKYTLPDNKEYGCYLGAFSKLIENSSYLNSESYQNSYFYCPYDSASFVLSLITADPFLKKFRVAENIQFMQSEDLPSLIMGHYGGVRPAFSNIQNGVGLFGSFVTNNKTVEAIMLPE